MKQQLATPGRVHLRVEVEVGSITVDATDRARDEGITLVQVEGPQADRVQVTQDGTQVAVIAPRSRFGFGSSGEQLHVTVELPSGSDAVVRSGSAGTRVTGSLTTLAVKSGSGEVVVARSAGQALVETGSGTVRIDVVAGELQVKSGSGDVHLGVTEAPTSISTGSGDVAVGTADAPLAVKTGSGDLIVTETADDVSMSTGSGDTYLRRVRRGRVGVRSASGDVRLGIPEGTPVWTDIAVLTGTIRSDLRPAGEPAEGQHHVEVRAKTSSGDVLLTRL